MDSEESFDREFRERSAKWSEPFLRYFEKSIIPKIPRSAFWIIGKSAPLDPKTGITTNLSEGFNFLIKDLMDWKEVPEDVIILAMKLLQQYYICETMRGKAGLGTYELRPKYLNQHH